MTDQPSPARGFEPGQRLDRYQIVSPLAVGGMGEVYRAVDLRLGREVALKVLPASLSSDADRLRRFEQEARATGALNHPNVMVVHDVGTHDGAPYLVTELLEGETLRERIEAGPIPLRKALEIAAGIGRGLAAAHQKGIVHRDLKPDNVFLTRDGRAKILDFGLAKVTGPLGVDTEALTQVAPRHGETMPGVILGTAGYMSPEQVRGEEADPRSDVFALGVILYEMLWDRRAFAQGSKVETLSAILWNDPLEVPPPPAVPVALQDLVRRCLEKDPEERFQSSRDLAYALEALGPGGTSGSGRIGIGRLGRIGGTGATRVSTLAGWFLVLVAVLALVSVSIDRFLGPGPPPRVTGYRPLLNGLPRPPVTWATDGERVYFTVDREGRYEVRQVPLTGGEPARLETPFQQALVVDASARRSAILVLGWDGGLTEWESRDETLWILPVPAGAARNTGLRGHAAAWSADGQHLAFSGGSDDYGRDAPGSLFVARGDGSAPRPLWQGTGEIPWVRWSPDGRRLRFGHFDRDASEWWAMEIPVDGGERPRRIVAGERGAWSPDGRSYVFGRWRPSDRDAAHGGPRFDLYARAEAGLPSLRESEPRQLTFGPLDFAAPVFTPDGRRLVSAGTLRRMELLRYVAARSRFERVPEVPGGFVEYSRDGKWVAWVDPSSMTLWRSRRDGKGRLQLTVPPMAVGLFRWSPEGRQIAFVADPTGGRQPRGLYLVSRDGGGLQSFSDPTANPVWDPCWLDESTVAWGNLRGDGSAVWTADLVTKQVSKLPGSDGMMGAKCARQGTILAARSWTLGYWRYRPETGWADLGVASDLWYPTFSRDGSTIYGLSLDERAIYRFTLADRRRVKVADLGAIEPTAPWLDVWMGLDPEDAPLILRNTGFSDLFVLDWAAP